MKKNDTLFSVIIPTLNEEKFLPNLLSDFKNQQLKNFKVIIVDANSRDKTKERALKFSAFIPLDFYSVKKKNVAYQRNYGAKKADEEYFIFLDADARIGTSFTENIYKGIIQKKYKRGLLFLPVLTTNSSSTRIKVLFNLINSVIYMSQSTNRPFAPGGSIFISRHLFFDINGFRENLYMSEDHDLVQRAKEFGVRAKILKNVKVAFNLRRVEKEGETVVLYKYFLALVYMLVNEKITNKAFLYEMGGDGYKDLQSKNKKGRLKNETERLRALFKKTSSFLSESLL